MHALDDCRVALTLPPTPHGQRDSHRGNALITAGATAGAVASLSALLFSRAALQVARSGADSTSRALFAAAAVPGARSRLAAKSCTEFGPALPWFDMRVARFGVHCEAIVERVEGLAGAVDKLSKLSQAWNARIDEGARIPLSAAEAFLATVNAQTADVCSQVQDGYVLLVQMERGVEEMRSVIEEAMVDGCVRTPRGESEALSQCAGVFADVVLATRATARRLRSMRREVSLLVCGVQAVAGLSVGQG